MKSDIIDFLPCPSLHDPPTTVIQNKFSALLRDFFHAIGCPKIRIHHVNKKIYKHAQQEDFFAWNPTRMEMVKSALKAEGLTEQNYDVLLYYTNYKILTSRADSKVLEPPKLNQRYLLYLALNEIPRLKSSYSIGLHGAKQPPYWQKYCELFFLYH